MYFTFNKLDILRLKIAKNLKEVCLICFVNLAPAFIQIEKIWKPPHANYLWQKKLEVIKKV